MNLFTFTGNLGKDAEVKYTPSGSAICEFSVAVKSGYGDKVKTNWVRCALFGKRAEGGLPPYLVKGTQVAVSGELELQEWENQNGKGAALSVKVNEIDLIGGNQGQQNAPQQQNNQSQGYAPQNQNNAPQHGGGYQHPQQGGYAPQQNAPQNNQGQQYSQGQQGAPQQQGGFNPNQDPDNIPF